MDVTIQATEKCSNSNVLGGEGSQKLVILVRDWQFPYEKQFGIEGGAELLRYETYLGTGDYVQGGFFLTCTPLES